MSSHRADERLDRFALMHWQAVSTYSKTKPTDLGPLVERAIVLRREVLADLRALAHHGLVPHEIVDRFGSSVAHTDLAQDLGGLASFVHKRWADLEGKTAMTPATIHDLWTTSFAILQGHGDRVFARHHVARAIARRNRAYTRVVRVYAEARAGIAYLRRNDGDADAIAPPLHARVKKRKKAGAEASE